MELRKRVYIFWAVLAGTFVYKLIANGIVKTFVSPNVGNKAKGNEVQIESPLVAMLVFVFTVAVPLLIVLGAFSMMFQKWQEVKNPELHRVKQGEQSGVDYGATG